MKGARQWCHSLGCDYLVSDITRVLPTGEDSNGSLQRNDRGLISSAKVVMILNHILYKYYMYIIDRYRYRCISYICFCLSFWFLSFCFFLNFLWTSKINGVVNVIDKITRYKWSRVSNRKGSSTLQCHALRWGFLSLYVHELVSWAEAFFLGSFSLLDKAGDYF